MKKHQKPLNIDEQINNLKNIGLIINDEKYAKDILDKISYFRLIKAYSLSLKQKNCNYNNVYFEDIVNLYLFNVKLRRILFMVIEDIEITLRCRISNYFSLTYGSLGYENENNFSNIDSHKKILSDIDREIQKNKRSPFVKNFKDNYKDGKLPLYAIIELFTFGTLSKFYKNLKNTDKKDIAQTFNIGYTYLESWIESISYVRNICAHYGRLYNLNLIKKPKLYKEYKAKKISNDRIFGVILCIKYLLQNNTDLWIEFVNELKLLIDDNKNIELSLIGFPKDWVSLLEN